MNSDLVVSLHDIRIHNTINIKYLSLLLKLIIRTRSSWWAKLPSIFYLGGRNLQECEVGGRHKGTLGTANGVVY